MRVVIVKGRVSIGDFCQGGVHTEGFSEAYLYLFLFFLFQIHCSCTLDFVIIFVIANLVLVYIYTIEVVITVLSPISPCVASFLSLYTCFLYLYAIYYFYFTQRCLDEFCLKCFRNTGCQCLLAINSLLAKFFKSLCQDRFYCIQPVNMS